MSGCGTGYLLQATRGQWQVSAARQPIARVVADPRTAEPLRERLRSLQQARAFAARELGLPDNRSYTTYADLGRPYVVWSVVATPELSVEPLKWCFPVVGCVAYRGYFHEQAASEFADRLRAKGHDAIVGGVAAYSTLGRFADPVLSTMLRYPQDDVVATLFHELAHQVAYLPGDSAFNEAFAVTVERAGIARWLRAQARPEDLQRYAERSARQQEFVALLRESRRRLADLYASDVGVDVKRAGKRQELQQLAGQLRALQERLGGRAGFSAWLERGLNNADLASVATYWDCVPAFERLLAEGGDDLPRFYARVKALAARRAEVRGTWCPAGG